MNSSLRHWRGFHRCRLSYRRQPKLTWIFNMKGGFPTSIAKNLSTIFLSGIMLIRARKFEIDIFVFDARFIFFFQRQTNVPWVLKSTSEAVEFQPLSALPYVSYNDQLTPYHDGTSTLMECVILLESSIRLSQTFAQSTRPSISLLNPYTSTSHATNLSLNLSTVTPQSSSSVRLWSSTLSFRPSTTSS